MAASSSREKGVVDRHNKITPGSQIAPPQIQIAPLAVTRGSISSFLEAHRRRTAAAEKCKIEKKLSVTGVEPKHGGSARARFSSQPSAGKNSATEIELEKSELFVLEAFFLRPYRMGIALARLRCRGAAGGVGATKRTKTAGTPMLMLEA